MRIFVAVLLLWLVLNESFAPGQVLLGAVVAFLGTTALDRLAPRRRGARRPLVALRLLGAVAADVVRSNVAVAGIVLGLARRNRVAGFLHMPVAVRSPEALATMACIVTATPGTSWVRYDPDAHRVTIHVLDLVDADEWIRDFKERYERRLQEIFE
jgi:multicomponent K+:H+ antiporter subunit E